MRRFFSLLLLVALIGGSALAFADERLDEASRHFREGEAAFKQGRPLAAAEAFERAHHLVPHGATLYNAGLAWQAAAVWQRAAQAFHDSIELGGLAPEQESDARSRLESVAPKVGRLDITAPPNGRVSVAHVESRPIPVAVFLRPGSYEVTLELAGQRTTQSVDVALGQGAIDLTKPSRAHRAARPVGPVPATDESKRGLSSTVGWVGIGGAAALSGIAIYLGLEALESRDAFDESGRTDAEAHDRAASLRTWTNVAWVAAGASATAGVVVLLTSDDGTSDARAELRVSPGAMTIRGRF